MLVAGLLALPGVARGDILPSGAKTVHYSYEVDNLAAQKKFTLVVWPRSCGSSGEPVGSIRALDAAPTLAHKVDYEVLEPKEESHRLLKYCGHASRVFALPAKTFPTAQQKAEEDDWHVGWKRGETYAVVPAIDAMTMKDRVPFFEKERKADFEFPYVLLLHRSSPIKALHDVFTVRALDDTRFEIAPVKVRYELVDGTRDEVAWTSGPRPPPNGKPQALRKPPGFGSPGEDAADDEDAAGPVPDAASPEVTADRAADGSSSRRLWGAIVTGVVLGGAIAFALRRSRHRR